MRARKDIDGMTGWAQLKRSYRREAIGNKQSMDGEGSAKDSLATLRLD